MCIRVNCLILKHYYSLFLFVLSDCLIMCVIAVKVIECYLLHKFHVLGMVKVEFLEDGIIKSVNLQNISTQVSIYPM